MAVLADEAATRVPGRGGGPADRLGPPEERTRPAPPGTLAPRKRTTRDYCSLDAPSGKGGSGPSLQEVGGAAAPGQPRMAADPGHLRLLAQVFHDAAEEASTAASDGTRVPGRGAAVALALAAAQGPSPGTASAG